MEICTRLAATHRHSTGGVRANHVAGEIEVKKFGGQRKAVRSCFRGGGAAYYHLDRPGLVERELRFEDLGVISRLERSLDGSSGVVDPHPATCVVEGGVVEPMGQRTISAFDAGNIDRLSPANQIERVPLVVCS